MPVARPAVEKTRTREVEIEQENTTETILLPKEGRKQPKSKEERAEAARRYFAMRSGLRKVSRYFGSVPLLYCSGNTRIIASQVDVNPDLWVAIPEQTSAKLYAFNLPDQLQLIGSFDYPKILSIFAANKGSLYLP